MWLKTFEKNGNKYFLIVHDSMKKKRTKVLNLYKKLGCINCHLTVYTMDLGSANGRRADVMTSYMIVDCGIDKSSRDPC